MKQATCSQRATSLSMCEGPARSTTTTDSRTGGSQMMEPSAITMRRSGACHIFLGLTIVMSLVAALPSVTSAQETLPTPAPVPQPRAPGTFGFGHSATADDVAAINIDVRPD